MTLTNTLTGSTSSSQTQQTALLSRNGDSRRGESSFEPRVLIIDDTPAIHDDFRKILAPEPDQSGALSELEAAFFGDSVQGRPRTGFAISSASKGQEGLALAEQALEEGRPYTIAFVNMRMPSGWDGVETAARLRKADADLQIVICSAYTDCTWERLAAEIEGNPPLLVKKPFDAREVLQLAETLHQKWNLARQARTHLADLDQILQQRTTVLSRLAKELGSVNQSLAQEMAKRSQAQAQLSAFAKLGPRLNRAQTIREACQAMIDTAAQLVTWESCRVELYESATQTLTHVLGAQIADGRRKKTTPAELRRPASPLALKVIEEGGRLILETESPHGAPCGTRRAASSLCVPICGAETTIGILTLDSPSFLAFNEPNLETLQALADFCGGALDRIAASSKCAEDLHQTEFRLKQANQQLSEASRRASLAEVATGVLHNVGNVLNSVNVSVHVMDAALKRSKAPNLTGIAAMLKDHAADLASFLTTDPKGRQLPGYIEHLANDLFSQQEYLTSELENLSKNIDHIKNIVVMQQGCAKISGVIETVKAQELVEDALNLNNGTLTRHGVQVVRQYDSHAPAVTVDRHKVVQLLVNLIGNAKQACDASGRAEKRMTLCVSNGSDKVCISVQDNGIGIAQESLEQIFNLGYTTRKDGHGFGLHNCLLAAKEMGGTLAVQSEGPDKGAIFKLELPCTPHN